MALTDLIALDRESLGWIKKETTFGTEVKPATANQFLLAGELSPEQNLGFIEDQQRRNSYSQLRRFAGRYEPGQANFPVYVKPSGSLGVAPEGGAFLEGLFGREVVTASTKVEYFLSRTIDAILTYTIWLKTGHFVYRLLGSVIDQGEFPLRADNSQDALSQAKYSVLFAELRWTGTDEAAQTIGGTPQATLQVADAKKFTVGSYIEVGAQTNSAAGFQVTAVNIGTNVITLSPSIANVTSGDQVKPWIPALGSEVGVPIHGRLGSATLGGANLPLLSGSITLANNFKMLNEEKNGLNFANRAARRSTRGVTVNASVYFDANQPRRFYDALNQVRGDLVFPWGSTAANRFKLTAKNCEFGAPKISGAEEKIIALEGQAFASTSLDDELVGLFD